MSSAMPLVSVIIPAYNGEAFIREAVESALSQTYPGLDIMVVDDGSTDGTKKKIEDLILDGRIKYISQKNAGPGIARNTGIKNSSGELIALLDQDDLWVPEKIEKQARFMRENPWADVVFCDGYGIDEKGGTRGGERERETKKYSARPDFIEMFGQGLNALPSAVMFRRQAFELVGDFKENKPGAWIADDWDMWFRMAAKGLQFGFISEMLFKKRGHSANLTMRVQSSSCARVHKACKKIGENFAVRDLTSIKKRFAAGRFDTARKFVYLGRLGDGLASGICAATFQGKYYFKLPGLLVRYLRFMLKRNFRIN